MPRPLDWKVTTMQEVGRECTACGDAVPQGGRVALPGGSYVVHERCIPDAQACEKAFYPLFEPYPRVRAYRSQKRDQHCARCKKQYPSGGCLTVVWVKQRPTSGRGEVYCPGCVPLDYRPRAAEAVRKFISTARATAEQEEEDTKSLEERVADGLETDVPTESDADQEAARSAARRRDPRSGRFRRQDSGPCRVRPVVYGRARSCILEGGHQGDCAVRVELAEEWPPARFVETLDEVAGYGDARAEEVGDAVLNGLRKLVLAQEGEQKERLEALLDAGIHELVRLACGSGG